MKKWKLHVVLEALAYDHKIQSGYKVVYSVKGYSDYSDKPQRLTTLAMYTQNVNAAQ